MLTTILELRQCCQQVCQALDTYNENLEKLEVAVHLCQKGIRLVDMLREGDYMRANDLQTFTAIKDRLSAELKRQMQLAIDNYNR